MLSLHEVESRLDLWGSLLHLWEKDTHGKEVMWNLTIGGMNMELSPKTMIMTWLVMIIIMIFVVLATRNMNLRRPHGGQNVLEMMFEGIRGQVSQSMDPQKGSSLLSIVLTFFIFILISNLIGLIPTFTSPTANPNTAFALALITFILIWFYGIRYKGIGYFKHWFKPYFFFLPLNLIEEFVKPLTLACRLFGNIYAGEILICTWLGMFYGWYQLTGGFIASVIWLGFSIFVGFIQAYVFTVLSINYIATAVAEHE